MDQKKIMETARAFVVPASSSRFRGLVLRRGGDVDSFLLTIEAQERVMAREPVKGEAREKGSCCDPRRASQHAGDPRTASLIFAHVVAGKAVVIVARPATKYMYM